MIKDPRSKKILLVSLFINAVVDSIAIFISEELRKFIGKYFVFYVIGFLITSLFLYGSLRVFFQKTKYGKAIFKWKDGVRFWILNSFFRRPTHIKAIYSYEERANNAFRDGLVSQLTKSKKIYFLLLSAHTMFYDEKEKFILDELKKFSYDDLQDKDIKIKLLSRLTLEFKERSQWFIDYMEKINAPYRCSYDEYLKRCQKIEEELKKILPTAKIEFYNSPPLWRIHLFDNTLYISIYEKEIEGHLTKAFQFFSDNPIYRGFLSYFESLK